ncbi:hypothetical protein, partial [Escherichia coli]|uniref:hypothetical protein n=1 Tax=Escherichia coli TaxID=562 RepID=UPI001BDCFEF8
KRVFLVILFTSFSGSLVSRISGAVQTCNFSHFNSKTILNLWQFLLSINENSKLNATLLRAENFLLCTINNQ